MQIRVKWVEPWESNKQENNGEWGGEGEECDDTSARGK